MRTVSALVQQRGNLLRVWVILLLVIAFVTVVGCSKNNLGTLFSVGIIEGDPAESGFGDADANGAYNVRALVAGALFVDGAPEVDAIYPPKGATGADVTALIILRFTETLGTAEAALSTAITVQTTDPKAAIGGDYSYVDGSANRIVVFDPTDDLADETEYEIALTSTLVDATGDVAASSGTIGTFTTGKAGDAVTFGVIESLTLPVAGATGVSERTEILVFFTEAVDRASVQNEFVVEDRNGNPQAGIFSFPSDYGDRVVVFTPAADYPINKRVDVTVDRDTQNSDQSEDLGSDYTFSFTTIGFPRVTAIGFSAGDPIAAAQAWTSGAGVDAVIITASAKTDEIVHQAAEMCRKRGRIVLVGVVGLNLRRADFYEKELSFQVSCSYGAGRYDDAYEQKGRDYPIGYVRWTEQRNFEAVLGAMASGQLVVDSLITDRIPLADAAEAYDKILNDPATLGVILEYPDAVQSERTVAIASRASKPADKVVAAMIGAGNFAKMTMGPALAKTRARLKYVSELTNAAAARHIAQKYGFENATTDGDAVWNDPQLNTVFIATGHASHAALVCKGIESGKHVFVEKPLAMNVDETARIIETAGAHPDLHLMVGFNRRFSPHLEKIKQLLSGRSQPLAMHFACNAGIIPPDVWVHDPEVGGGRIVGEACHFMDLLAYIADSPIVSVASAQMEQGVAVKEDKMSIVLSFEDGSVGTVNYFGNGHKAYPKETIEVYSEGRILRLDNFRRLDAWGFSGFRRMKTKLDKGHQAEFDQFIDRIAVGGKPLIPLDQLVNATLASFAAMTSAAEQRTICLAEEYANLSV